MWCYLPSLLRCVHSRKIQEAAGFLRHLVQNPAEVSLRPPWHYLFKTTGVLGELCSRGREAGGSEEAVPGWYGCGRGLRHRQVWGEDLVLELAR